MSAPPPLVLVHSPLVGPSCWEPTAAVLRRRGYDILTPSLVDALEQGPPYYPSLAASVAAAVDRAGIVEPVVLVVHSGAGALVPAIGDSLAAGARLAVFVDAILPHPGRSWFDTAPGELRDHLRSLASNGRLPPWNGWFDTEEIAAELPEPAARDRFVTDLPRLPLAYFDEAAPATARLPPHHAYVRLSDGYTAEADQAEKAGWPVRHLGAGHLAVFTRPDTVADVLTRTVANALP